MADLQIGSGGGRPDETWGSLDGALRRGGGGGVYRAAVRWSGCGGNVWKQHQNVIECRQARPGNEPMGQCLIVYESPLVGPTGLLRRQLGARSNATSA